MTVQADFYTAQQQGETIHSFISNVCSAFRIFLKTNPLISNVCSEFRIFFSPMLPEDVC